MKNSLKSKIITAAFIALTLVASAHASVLNIDDNGQLLGASGVDVNGTLFDVTFEFGTCNEVFGGCTSASEFSFDSLLDLFAAGRALIELEVFENIDVFPIIIDPFDVRPPALAIPLASPRFNSVSAFTFTQNIDDDFDLIFLSPVSAQTVDFQFPVFTRSVSTSDETFDVTSPATFGIFTLGLLGLGLRRKLNQ